jgi:epoxyqueuosine reductase
MRASRSTEIIVEAELYPGIRAGIARLDEVLDAPSYHVVPEGSFTSSTSDELAEVEWPPDARSVLVLGLHHPEGEPSLDWWGAGVSPGDRRLMDIVDLLKVWLESEMGIGSFPLPYSAGRGGVFLKDAAALAGLGIIGRSNLLVTPEWGPRIRLRALLLEGDLTPTGRLRGFAPCESCAEFCHLACPRDAYSAGAYHRPTCIEQINRDVVNKLPERLESDGTGPRLVVKYCRACELACPVGH